MSDAETKYDAYLTRYESERPRNPVLLEAAADPGLPTDFLFDRASAADDEVSAYGAPTFALLVLQERADDAVVDRSLAMLEDEVPTRRRFAASILRELRRSDPAHPRVPDILAAIRRLAPVETDESMLGWLLAIVGWRCLPEGRDLLLAYATDERRHARDVVANNLLNGFEEGDALPPEVVRTFVAFTKDEDADVRSVTFWHVAEFPSFFVDHPEFEAAARAAAEDPEEQVRKNAARALEALRTGKAPEV